MTIKVPYINLPQQYQDMREELLKRIDEVLSSGSFILRKDVTEFEDRMSELLGVHYVIGVNSGTDALYLSAKALGIGPGDEVITVAHTFVATVASIVHCGATPVLVDIQDDFNMDIAVVESAITTRTKAIIPVHLNGRTCDMDALMQLAERRGLIVIEDTAQALCSKYNGQAAGSFGAAGCFSMHPMKNLGVGGDGGFISTNDPELNRKIRLLRDHGQKSKEEIECFGYNSRLDNLHAAIALVKMPYLSQWMNRRRELAAQYQEALGPIEELTLPPPPKSDDSPNYDVYSSYVVRTDQRDALLGKLREAGIEVFAHLSPPMHHQQALGLSHWRLPATERAANQILSLPLYPELSDEDQDLVVHEVRSFFRG